MTIDTTRNEVNRALVQSRSSDGERVATQRMERDYWTAGMMNVEEIQDFCLSLGSDVEEKLPFVKFKNGEGTLLSVSRARPSTASASIFHRRSGR